jgi:chromate reductase
MTTHKVGYLIGSLATASINRKLAKALVRLAPAELDMREIPFRDLPLYSYDYDPDFPPVARAFKAALAEVDAVVFVTPEYNRSIPGGLKNAIDWASRRSGQNSFNRKPAAVIGTSPGSISTALAQQALRAVLSFCNAPQMNAPEAYIRFTPGLVTDEGEVTNEGTEKFLKNYMAEFAAFITRVCSFPPKSGCAAGRGAPAPRAGLVDPTPFPKPEPPATAMESTPAGGTLPENGDTPWNAGLPPSWLPMSSATRSSWPRTRPRRSTR